MMLATGYLMAMVAGLCLGMMGSGGSILTMPVLVYLFRFSPVAGTAYSLFIVGLTSLAGLLIQFRRGAVDLPAAAAFAIPSLGGVYLVRGHVIHELPETLRLPLGTEMARDAFIMVAFGAVMVTAAVAMLRGRARPGAAAPLMPSSPSSPAPNGSASSGERRPDRVRGPRSHRLPWIGVSGLLVGGLTGFVGAGGGFLIVPALVLLSRLPMETAVGTSLAVITAQSFAGFATDWSLMERIDWPFLLGFSLLSIAGVAAGGILGRRLGAERLRPAFAWFILVLAAAILVKEFHA